MSARKDIETELAAVGALADDAAIDIGATALALAALDRPAVALEPYIEHLRALAAAVPAFAPGATTAVAQAAALREAIHVRHGYAGDTLTYDDPQNADLLRVIDRRRGLPVALGILYLHVARAQGWTLAGLNFPGHFLLRLEAGDRQIVLDPFRGGAELDAGDLRELLKRMAGPAAELEAGHYRAVSCRDVLLRLQNNIKTRALQAGDAERAAQVLHSMLLLAPSQAPLWRELGVIEAERGNLQHAVAAFQSCLSHATDASLQRDAAAFLRRLRNKLN
jgi:regulator of sirC expression with transglutaminase-like and TPR domain